MRAKLDFGAEIDILSGKEFDDGIDRLGKIWSDKAFGLKHMRIPILTGVVPAGGALTIGSSTTPNQSPVGPNQGYAWQVKRVSVFGLQTNDVLSLYWGDPLPAHFVGSFSPAGPEWDSGHGLLLKPGDFLCFSGTGLSVGATYTINGEAIEAPAEQIYKLIGG